MSELRIFIADDEAPARAPMQELLTDIRGELATRVVGESDNGLDVIDRRPGSGAQVLLLDIQMPGFGSGIDGLRFLRGDPRWRLLPVVILTGIAQQKARGFVKDDAITRLLFKPPDWSVMERTLKEMTGQS